MTAGDFEDFMLEVAIEGDVCEGRRRLQRSHGVGVEFEFMTLMAEDEFSSLVGGRIDDHE
jgi:hypothetical protein